jgi:hypothetical protein
MNTERKARKRAGIKFYKAPKVGTPLIERASFTGLVPGAVGTRSEGRPVPRSWAQRMALLELHGVPMPKEMKDERKAKRRAARKAAKR